MPTLREFVLTACAVELGLEVPGHRQAGDPLEPDARAKGLDLTAGECDALVAFVASLPAPSRQVPTGVAEADAIREGERAFGGHRLRDLPHAGPRRGRGDLQRPAPARHGGGPGRHRVVRRVPPRVARTGCVEARSPRRGTAAGGEGRRIPARTGKSGGRRRCGACAIRVPTCTTGVPTRSTRRSPCTAARGRTRRPGISGSRPGDGSRSGRSSSPWSRRSIRPRRKPDSQNGEATAGSGRADGRRETGRVP